MKTLTPDQLKAYQDILIFFNQTFGGFHLLQGYAGTGKTYLSIEIVNELANSIQNKILITAPTHKALQVLQKESKFNYPNVDFSTIHSALGLKESVDGFGNQTFKPDSKNKNPKITKYKLILIDETSMLHDQLFNYLIPHLKRRSLKILFIGDPAQIPPVKKLDAIPFKKVNQEKYNIGVSTLNQIVRQTQNNPIIKKTLEIRSNLNREQAFLRETEVTPFGMVKFLRASSKNDQTEFIKVLEKLFTSNSFQNDPDFVKIIAWRNDTVNLMNEIIREMIYGSLKVGGKELPKILPTEKLIMDAPLLDGSKTILNTNDEVTVVKYDIKQIDSVFGMKFKIYHTTVEKLTIDNRIATHKIMILHEDSYRSFGRKLDSLAEIAKAEKQGTWKAAQKWRTYYNFKNHFASIKYNYCITAHKAQGSTYENAIVLEYDLNANPKVVERNRIKYTACTRPKNNLYIIS